jgi:hypothetical protein
MFVFRPKTFDTSTIEKRGSEKNTKNQKFTSTSGDKNMKHFKAV